LRGGGSDPVLLAFSSVSCLGTVPYVHPQDGHPSIGDSVSQNQ
jgi:hypothetical protein